MGWIQNYDSSSCFVAHCSDRQYLPYGLWLSIHQMNIRTDVTVREYLYYQTYSTQWPFSLQLELNLLFTSQSANISTIMTLKWDNLFLLKIMGRRTRKNAFNLFGHTIHFLLELLMQILEVVLWIQLQIPPKVLQQFTSTVLALSMLLLSKPMKVIWTRLLVNTLSQNWAMLP